MTVLPSLRSLPHADFLARLKEAGLPAFQAEVIKKFLWKHGARSFDAITPLSLKHRSWLEEHLDFGFPVIRDRVVGEDGTTKLLFDWNGTPAESVLMPSQARGMTLCLSTQSGCGLGCAFCATGRLGLNRNLTFAEILDQVLVAGGEGSLGRLVFMGMGEPLLNLDELVPALAFLTSPQGLHLSRKRITVSTVGLIKEMRRLIESGIGVELAVSLHAVDDGTRVKLMPATKSNPLIEVLETAQLYAEHANARVTIEYLLLDGVNDSEVDALQLAEYSRRFAMPVNIIRYNQVAGTGFVASRRLEEFVKQLAGKALAVTVRRSKGANIAAACGQLAAKAGAKTA